MTAAAANRRFARKSKDWLNVFNQTCNAIHVEPQELCPNAFQIPLITPGYLEDKKEDSCRVTRLLGHLYVEAQFPLFDNNPIFNAIALAASTNLMRLALKRYELSAGAQDQIFNPMLGDDLQTDPGGDDQGDYSDARFIRQWEHLFTNTYTNTLMPQATISYPVGIVSGGNGATVNAGTWAIAEGGINTSIDTEVECRECETSYSSGFNVAVHDIWHLPIDLKLKPGLLLKENQGIQLFGGWESIGLDGEARRAQVSLNIYGGLRALVET